jgi:hypothetical protein
LFTGDQVSPFIILGFLDWQGVSLISWIIACGWNYGDEAPYQNFCIDQLTGFGNVETLSLFQKMGFI